VVQEAIDDQRLILPGPARAIAVAIPDSLHVHASRDVLLTLAHNLVGNALQHAPRGSIAISWTEDACLTIDDDGPGFPASDEKSRSRGYGIGLTLAQRLCETQGWRLIRGRSSRGGARVDIHFPTTSVRGPESGS
jgi:two-component system sensor kinase ParS